MNKKILSVLVFCLMFAMGIASVSAATTGSSNGTATVGSATPTISMTNCGLYTSGGGSSVTGAAINVLQEYWYNSTIGDANGLSSLVNVTYRVYENTWGTWSTADNNQTHYTFQWLESSNTWSEIGPNSSPDIVTGDCVGTTSGTSATFRLAFQLSPSANYTSSATWKINCTAFVSNSLYASDYSITFQVNAYYAIVVASGSSTHAWTGCNAGDNNDPLTTPASGYLTVYGTSNHYYYAFEVESTSSTLASGGNTIPISNVKTYATNTVGSATSLTTSYADVGGDTGISPTNAINVAAYIYMWISIPAGTPAGSYTYTLNIEIAAT